jgi:hypothetical protein
MPRSDPRISSNPAPGEEKQNRGTNGGLQASSLPVAHYNVVSATRGSAEEPAEPKTLFLKRERLELRIHLPVGSKDGKYEMRLHRNSNKREVLKWEAEANRANSYTLSIEDDFRRLPYGAYLLAIFPPGFSGEVPGYPVRLISKE